jgi:DNA-directed RNA polymerase specialized sigma24 family protein
MATSSTDALPSNGLYESVGCQQTVEALRDALNGLSTNRRLVFTLHVMHQLSYQEIATILDQPVDQVKLSYHTGREALRQWLAAAVDASLNAKMHQYVEEGAVR